MHLGPCEFTSRPFTLLYMISFTSWLLEVQWNWTFLYFSQQVRFRVQKVLCSTEGRKKKLGYIFFNVIKFYIFHWVIIRQHGRKLEKKKNYKRQNLDVLICSVIYSLDLCWTSNLWPHWFFVLFCFVLVFCVFFLGGYKGKDASTYG